MVNTAARQEYAQLLRHFAAGLITNQEYERRVEPILEAARGDAGLWEVYDAVWGLYDDFRSHRLTLTLWQRGEIARALLFLYTEAEYRWPRGCAFHLPDLLLTVLTLGLWSRVAQWRYEQHLRALGEPDVWPFLNTAELDRARREVRLLGRALPR